jgi:Coenzyme PQQ synthesis protein D (PqqD)
MKLAKYTKFREERFGGVLFETRSEKVYSLNPSAAAVVREIVNGTDESQIIERLRSHFQDGQNQLAPDIQEFLANLRQKGLVED